MAPRSGRRRSKFRKGDIVFYYNPLTGAGEILGVVKKVHIMDGANATYDVEWENGASTSPAEYQIVEGYRIMKYDD